MKHYSLTNQTMYDSSNLRAEDGWTRKDRRSALYEAIFVPVVIFAIIAIVLLLFCHPAFGHVPGRGIEVFVKDGTGAVLSGSTVTSDRHALGQSGPRPVLEQSAPWIRR
jgi:hypothetical protein